MLRNRKTSYLIVAVVILFALSLLRETGYVQLNYYHLQFTNHTDRHIEKYIRHADSWEIPVADISVAYSVDTDLARWLGAIYKQRNAIGNGNKLTININHIDLEGGYWLPVYKTGRCTYNLSIEVESPRPIGYRGSVSGYLEFSLKGLCSIRQLKVVVADKIVEETMKSIMSSFDGFTS